MIKIRESQLPPSYKDYIDNWVTYEKSRTEEEKLYWDSIWNQLDKTLVNTLLGIPIYTISGAQIRGLPKDIVPVDLDFCLGGTWARYPWIVDGAMAIEYKLWNCANEKERIDRNAIIIHEHVEVTEGLTEGLSYERAHEDLANKEESRYRLDPQSSKYYTALAMIGLEGPIQENGILTRPGDYDLLHKELLPILTKHGLAYSTVGKGNSWSLVNTNNPLKKIWKGDSLDAMATYLRQLR